MSILDDALGLAERASKIADKVAPWWDVVEPLIEALGDGKLTKEEVVLMAKAAMLRATEEKLKAELKP